MKRNDINSVVGDFVNQLTLMIEDQVQTRARDVVVSALGGGPGIRQQRKKPSNPAHKLQGVYMGRLKAFSGKDREKIRTFRAEKGTEAAIKMMAGLKSN